MNKLIYFKYLVLVLCLFGCGISTALAERDRGAGGGGDPLLAIIKAGKSRARLREEGSHGFQLGDLKNLFCEQSPSGLKKIKSLEINQRESAALKIRELCANKERIEIVQNLKLAGESVSAVNWPKVSRLAFDNQRIASILKTFDSETQQLLMEVLFSHEVLSLVELESTGIYTHSIEIFGDSQLPNQPTLEKVIGDAALFFEMNQSIADIDQYQKEKEYPGVLVANNPNFIREQLLNFSPLFDEEIKSTIASNFSFQFGERSSRRGSSYIVPVNDHLLEPVLQRLKIALEKRKINVDFSELKSSWALAIQLHQLLLAVDEIDANTQREKLRNLNFKIKTRTLSFNIPFNRDKISRDDRTVEITFNESLNSQLESLKSLFTFYVLGKAEFEPEESILFIQNWPALNIGLSGDYTLFMESGTFDYRSYMPSYRESRMRSSSGSPYSLFKKDLGLMTKEPIKDFLHIELRDTTL